LSTQRVSHLIKKETRTVDSFIRIPAQKSKRNQDLRTTMMMKFLSLLSLSLLPSLSFACSCFELPSLNTTLYENSNSIVIAGRVLAELKLTTTDEFGNYNRYFAFKVRQVTKAPCYIQKDDVILITTGGNSGLCGVDLQPDTRYTLEAYALNSNPLEPSMVQVGIGSCNYIGPGDLPAADKQVLRKYSKANPHPTKCAPPPKPCTTGADCNPRSEYCNVAANQCVTIDAPCPTPPVECFAAPCTVTLPCETTAPGPLTCLDNYCGGCNAIFLDADRSQVCN
jgi:hypothetical protein